MRTGLTTVFVLRARLSPSCSFLPPVEDACFSAFVLSVDFVLFDCCAGKKKTAMLTKRKMIRYKRPDWKKALVTLEQPWRWPSAEEIKKMTPELARQRAQSAPRISGDDLLAELHQQQLAAVARLKEERAKSTDNAKQSRASNLSSAATAS